MALELRFRKTGKEIKTASRNRVAQLEQRLVKRNAALDDFMQDKNKVRSYLIRSTQQIWMGHRQVWRRNNGLFLLARGNAPG